MAKKRKVSRNTEPSGPREVDAKDARLTIRSYEDVADEQDEYWANQDRINFDSDNDQPRSKRLKKEDDFLEVSDEEVFAQDESDEESEEETNASAKKKAGMKAPLEAYSEDEEQGGEDEEGDEGWWGASKKDYYNADAIETEADALEEEAEAKRLQAKKLSKMQEEDFAFDEDEWLAPKDASGEDAETVTEVLKEVELREDMTAEERYKLLQARYPEFDYLVDEFRELQPLLASLQKEAEGKPAKSLEVAKSWILGCYVASLASYFAVLTSPTRDGDGSVSTLSPSELRDHEVMETLVECREAWLKVKQFKTVTDVSIDTDMVSGAEDEDNEMMGLDAPVQKKTKKLSKAQLKAQEQKEIEKARKAKAAKKSLANLDKLLKGAKISPKEESARRAVADSGMDDDRSDFGEEETLDARTAADKAKRKKSLKFYTSQIVQKSSKRAGAGRDAGGDADIPYRERLRDRQARLNAEAERRGKKDSKHGAALGEGDSDGEDANVAKQVRDDGDDEYYDMVAAKAQSKREDKVARFEALAKAGKGERVVEAEELGPDGKRQITYQIQKNKGLTPHRKKAVRNPRVKKRIMFEDKKKKLRSVKAVYKGGEGKGGYQGELSGIKTGLVKSTKL
ncbi:Sas10 C-terminal domain-containing protein [Cladorrhinum sp. PSN332]|nr:Sas10 C-terminal domain-containing protein [Cladorrhinum sp. PSN332]